VGKHGTVLARARRAFDEATSELREADPEVTTTCVFCSWSTRAPLEQARERFRQHVCPGR
jgi:hypothetical protein